MKITILNGSPKSSLSATIQSMNYLEIKYPEIEFEQIHLISAVRKGDEAIKEAIKSISEADGVIWAFPLYHLLVPAHMKKFIEKLYELNIFEVFKDKYATTFTTSIHYYDNTAHDYMEGISNDLQMSYVSGLSHDMNDLLIEEKQNELCFFFENFLESITTKEVCTSRFKPLTKADFSFKISETESKVSTGKRTVVVTDSTSGSNIDKMIKKFASVVDGPLKIVNLNDSDFKNYCIGCCSCAPTNKCVFHDKDDYRKTLDFILDNSDIVVYAGELKDRYFSSKMKLYFDRSFCYTHIPVFRGRQIAYLVSGAVNELPHMKEIMYAYASNTTNLGGIVSDESSDNEAINSQIESLARRCIKYAEHNYIKTSTFQAVGAQMLFTDAIKNNLGMFLEDYKYYKKNDYFKKPSIPSKLQVSIFRFMMKIEPFKKLVRNDIFNNMIAPHRKFLKTLSKASN